MVISRRSLIAMLGGAIAYPTSMAWASNDPRSSWPLEQLFLFTRKLSRDLHDGLAITVERRWEISIAQTGGGWMVDGKQVGVAVGAPQHLAQIAEIEEARIDTSTFPIALGSDGVIVRAASSQHDEVNTAGLERAINKVSAIMSDKTLGAHDHRRHQQFLAELQSSAVKNFSVMPQDLFFPRAPRWEHSHPIALNGSIEGHISVAFDAESSAETGLLSTAKRSITTALGGDKRHSVERWSLSSINS